MEGRSPSVMGLRRGDHVDMQDEGVSLRSTPSPVPRYTRSPSYTYDIDAYGVIYM